MEDVPFLTAEQVLVIHQRMIGRYGGDSTVRNIGLVESAVMMPRQGFGGQYRHPSIASMATAYLFYLCANHGFADGNKRTAVGAALIFLDANGHELALTIDELEQITLDIAASSLDKAGLTTLFEAACRPKA